MPGVTGPSDYSREPPRHPSLKINAKEPFNAEPPRSALGAAYVTPVDLFYKRNHGPIPIVDDIHSYSVSITGLIENPKQVFFKDIMALPKYNVTATMQCAGNRRTAMSQTRTVKGVGWDVSAIGNAVWGGAKLADVLELVGIPKFTGATKSGGKHVEFVSVDRCKEENGGPYKASIPLIQATSPDADVLLAYEMNGEIRFILLQNRQGKTRLAKYYVPLEDSEKHKVEYEVHRLVVNRDPKFTNFVEFRTHKVIYRRYAGLFFSLCVDITDNELAYLECIHLFVEILDHFFSNVCELDLVFNFHKVC
ncbi:hypothetical protein ACLB2K_073296 [Fragaria x ananassa]